ncbi:MAG: NusA-like transcription termination signal-binding factor [Candidatus Micrarchaeota archaeon]
MVTLGNDELKCITFFESVTGAGVKDCVIDKEFIIFVVNEGDVGRAIGKGGSSISRVRQQLGKSVYVVEHAETAEEFVKNIFMPVPINNLNIQEKNNSKTAVVDVDPQNRGSAIGRNGERIRMGRLLMQRRFGMDLRVSGR